MYKRQGFAIMPFDILAQVEGVGIGILVVFPAFRQRGYDLVFRIVRRKAGEDQGIDLAMLIQGGVCLLYTSRCV